MAGVGKLARLFIKMGKKDLVRKFSKAPVKTTLKTAGNVVSWPFKKVLQLQDYYLNPYTTGGKIKKAIFAPLWYGAIALPITGLAGILGGLGTGIYGAETGNENLKGAGFALFAKSFDLTCASLGGLILGGPIGGIAAGAYSIFGDKSLFASMGKLVDKKDGENIETFVNKKRDELFAYIKGELGLTSTTGQAEQEEEHSEETPEKSEITAENNTTTVVPADSTLVTPLDSTRVVPPLSSDSTLVAPTDSTLVAPSDTTGIVPQDSTKTVIPPVADNDEAQGNDDDSQQPPVQPVATNIFGGEINGITKASVEIVKGDCLWNIAKRELQAANPGETITNAQILKQVKEFGRLNPEMFGENPSLQKLDLIYPDKQLKLCA